MSCDKLVFDLSQEVEGSPNIFVKKDWINILDNQNGNYGNNQCIIDTSQLTNSNKYLNFREGYLSIPLLLTLTGSTDAFNPGTAATACDYTVGLKNWFGSIVHNMSVDYNGVNIIQQTNFINMWNAFKLMTSLSWNDVATIGPTIGFYPDNALSWAYSDVAGNSGIGVTNNRNFSLSVSGIDVAGVFNGYQSNDGHNEGFLKRQTYINYDPTGVPGSGGTPGTYNNFLSDTNTSNLWKSFISNKVDNTGSTGVFQISVRATVYLKHLHSFFQMAPLLKGAFLKITLNLNNSSTTFSCNASGNISLNTSNVPSGGVQPLMIASGEANNGSDASIVTGDYICSLSVGSKCLNSQQLSVTGIATGRVGDNILLYVPGYAFNPPFEQAYLSNPIKNISYTDVYQYPVNNITSGNQFSSLLSNGIARLKSVLVIPFHSQIVSSATSGATTQAPYMSPFDDAGCGPTSPLCLLSNFNVVVSGQNMIYNTQMKSFEQFNNQLYGVNAINGGMTEGLSSGLIDALSFEMKYCYYYVDVSRMLPIEESVPKSVQIIGTNLSGKPISLITFIEFGCDISVDILTGARV